MKKTLVSLTLAIALSAVLAGCTAAPAVAANASATPLQTQDVATPTPTQAEPSATAAQQTDSAAYPSSTYSDDNKIPYDPALALEGAAGVEREGDHKDSKYYVHYDFYNMQSDDTLTILPQFKTIQQTTEWTCGPASVLMVLNYFDKMGELNELGLAALRQKDEPGATNLRQMMNIFDALGGFEMETTYDYQDDVYAIPTTMILDTLKKGIPVIIGWDEWGGHWQVVIGYDTMGTETEIDDVLIIADPYDTTDHDQDGYVIQSFERFYYNWLNTFDPDFDSHVFLAVRPEGYAE